MDDVAFIGLGSIGAPMAHRLLGSGLRLTACDVSPGALESFAGTAAGTTTNASDCASSRVVIVMVATDEQAEDAVSGPSGLLTAVDPAAAPVLVVMSSVLPRTIVRIAEACSAKNVRVVDAPVSGLPAAAERGTLSIMAGGSPDDIEALGPVFGVLGSVTHVGGLSSGTVAKLANNIIGIANFVLTVEAVQIATAFGMNPRDAVDLFEASSGRNFYTRDWDVSLSNFRRYSRTVGDSKTITDISRKDLKNAHGLAREAGVDGTFLESISRAMTSVTYEQMLAKLASVVE